MARPTTAGSSAKTTAATATASSAPALNANFPSSSDSSAPEAKSCSS
jgi:hypothetical protein